MATQFVTVFLVRKLLRTVFHKLNLRFWLLKVATKSQASKSNTKLLFFLAGFAPIWLHTQICIWLSQVKQDYQTHHVNVITENSFEEISVVITHGHI